jgi:hypothetical protein
MRDEARKLYLEVEKAHEDLYNSLQALRKVTSQDREIRSLTDTAYALNESLKLLESAKKEINITKDMLTKVIGALWVQVNNQEPIRTWYCTGTPRVKMAATLPSRKSDPEKYGKLMDSLNIPRELWDRPEDEHQIVHIHWPGMVDYVSELSAQGLPLPDGVDMSKAYPNYALTLRPRKEIRALESEES